MEIKKSEKLKYKSPGSLKESDKDLSSNKLIIPKMSTTEINLNTFSWKLRYLNKKIFVKKSIDRISKK